MLGFAAIEPSVTLHVPLSALKQLTAGDLTFMRQLTRISEYGMDVAIATLGDLLIRDAVKRIAATLLRIAPPPDPAQPGTICGLTQEQLSEMANAARHVVNRTLKRLQADGCIQVAYCRIIILDRPRLEAICE